MRERSVERYLRYCVENRGGLCYKFTSPQRKNVPDRIVLMRGKICFVECKATGEKPTLAQLREHARILACGIPVLVIDSYEGVQHLIGRMT